MLLKTWDYHALVFIYSSHCRFVVIDLNKIYKIYEILLISIKHVHSTTDEKDSLVVTLYIC